MKRFHVFWVALVAIALIQSGAGAGTIVPGDITNGAASYTTPDGLVTLNPFTAGGTPHTIGLGGCCIGVTGGSSTAGVDDGDGDPATTADRESLDVVLAAGVSMTEFGLAWTRADGPEATDGVAISGFLSNPNAAVDGTAAGDGVSVSYDAGTLYVNHPWRAGAVSTITLNTPTASLGQTLSMSVNDSDQGTPQGVFNSITYTPEPSTLMLGSLAMLCMAARRK